ncbi:mannitol dehydrogenase family protein [Phycicoccus endophyticus]|uniref:Mannitol-1-phosphate 5-dehydrogenase n=1 Tax=Phycicoccus endophyticus TaxID=1690220 RepID=A0A7G9R1M0_9MICO|nr:mannitol dehydrogenase family protein [Phycicoccus endophyticus]NHI18717.1 mannitol dehydrogenase family protein [Phycicoccus endophyticus]QNN49495.1 mannitol dehydrogenase family protein [Phycicoccus endophyticus]
MLRLSQDSLERASAATVLPGYDRSEVTVGTVHFGVGGFHRAHQAMYLDSLMARDPHARVFGICGVNLLPQDRALVEAMNRQDCLYTVLVRHADGSTTPRVIGSIVRHIFAPEAPEAVLSVLEDPSVRIVTLTITEGGYFYAPASDTFDMGAPALLRDAANPLAPSTAFGYIVHALNRRRLAGVPPFTVQSCDNLHGNGDITRRVVLELAERVSPQLYAWVHSEVSFPGSMVDRITPRSTPSDRAEASELTGLVDDAPVSTEDFSQWVVHDDFTSGRPAWQDVGVQMVADVAPYERMKMRLLNVGHASIAYAGRLLGHEFAHEACEDPSVQGLLVSYQREAALTLTPIPGTDFEEYSASVVRRFRNPQMRDSVTRLTDQSSTMLANYTLPVVRDLLDKGLEATAAITIVACWARFMEGRDEQGREYDVVDRRGDELRRRAAHHDEDIFALVRDNPLFDGLRERDSFLDEYGSILRAIRSEGTREVLGTPSAQRAASSGAP